MGQGIVRRIVTLAERLEPDRNAIWDWLFHAQIETLGSRTAMELIFTDQGERVVALLEHALRDEEGASVVTGIQRLPRHDR
ncbi:hypothetical protein EC912_10644 [Luteibacter rhizovicinus]|uniref:Uncharacterized protein n=1 Tax=Luteibacter rhizovicinus TaxID=242606 RepID=A0A4R3YKB4_9GAMM|nr:hypothetical protein [Luteibacter rhizovicinus]TCV92706.1 hypothetical protein EC912_10644 [Luteibacter rhizovicinus]